MHPTPNYAPQFVKSAEFGYLLSAMFGVGCILAVTLVLRIFVARRAAAGSVP